VSVVDYRLLPHFTASRASLEAARSALPARWRADERPIVQDVNERWVAVRAKARTHLELVRSASTTLAPVDEH
jgi:hypothetical protein